MRDEGKLLCALGLCARARKLIYGTPMICEAMKDKKKLFLVLSASDNSQNTEKRLRDRCAFYGIAHVTLETDGEALAHALGKSARLAAVAVSDENMYCLVSGAMEEKIQ